MDVRGDVRGGNDVLGVFAHRPRYDTVFIVSMSSGPRFDRTYLCAFPLAIEGTNLNPRFAGCFFSFKHAKLFLMFRGENREHVLLFELCLN